MSRATKILIAVAGFYLLVLILLGVLFGVSRAYRWRPWTYWLSPLLDLPAVLRIFISALRRRQIWRDRIYVRRRSGEYELETTRRS